MMPAPTTNVAAPTGRGQESGRQSSPRHLTSIEALRGIAALYVVCLHTATVPAPHLPMPVWIAPLVLSGGTGVTMFFIISAFTLSLSWYERNEGVNSVRNFYVRRIFRIVPLYYFLLFVSLLRDWFKWHHVHTWKTIALSVVMLFDLFPGKSQGIVWASWTIGVEMLFYLLFPLFAILGSTQLRLSFCLLGTLALAVVFYFAVQSSDISPALKAEYLPTGLAMHLPVFVLGMMTYMAFSGKHFRRISNPTFSLLLVTIALALHVAFAFSGLYQRTNANLSTPAWILLVLGLAIRPVTPIINAVTRFYGRISYSIYLNHPIFVVFLTPVYYRVYRHLNWHGPALLVCLIITFATLTPWAYFTYRFIEQPGIRFGSRLIKKLSHRMTVEG